MRKIIYSEFSESATGVAKAAFSSEALSDLNAIVNDNLISQYEKVTTFFPAVSELEQLSTYLVTKATELSIDHSALDTAKANFYAYLETLEPEWDSPFDDTIVVRITLNEFLELYTDALYSLQVSIQGLPGQSAIGGYLTNESHVVSASAIGTVTDLTGAEGTFYVYDGLNLVDPLDVTFSVQSEYGITTTLNTDGTYEIDTFSYLADNGTATLRAEYNGVTIDKTYSISKSKEGINAITLVVVSNRQTVNFTAAGGADPSTQNTVFTANKQNTSATITWTVTDANGVARTPTTTYLSNATGDTTTMTVAQFNSARNGTTAVIVTGTITDGDTYSDSISVSRVVAGAEGGPGESTVAALLSNEAHSFTATLAGVVTDFAGSGGTIRVFEGVDALFYQSGSGFPAGSSTYRIEVAATGVTAGAISGSGGVTATIANVSAVSSGVDAPFIDYTIKGRNAAGVSFQFTKRQVFSKAKSGAVGANAKTMTVISNRQTVFYDAAGAASPITQTTTFEAFKQNTTATVNWTLTDAAGVARTPVTSFLSAASGDSVTMTEAQFASARNGTSGVIVTGTLTDGGTFSDRVSLVRVQDGLAASLLTIANTGASFTFNGSGTAVPASQTITLTAQLQNLSGNATWVATAFNASGTSLGGITMSGSGNTRTMTNGQFMAPGATAYARVTATLGAFSAGITLVRVADGALGLAGNAGLAAFLTNDAFVVPAFADGTVQSYAGATGSFRVFAGSTDVSASFTLATQANPQVLTMGYVAQAYTVSGGFDPGENTANVTIRATGSGAYTGVTIDRVFTLAKLKGGYEIVGTLPVANNFEGRIVFLTTDDKLYRYTGAAWITSVPATDITGQLTNAQIAALAAAKLTGQIISTQVADDAITTPKLAAGAVTAAEIAANTITAGQIAANTITAGQIAATTITAGQIAANAITTDKIYAGAITAAKLATTELITVTAQIADATITNAKISTLDAAKITTGQLVAARIDVNGVITAATGIFSGSLDVGGKAVFRGETTDLSTAFPATVQVDGNNKNVGVYVRGNTTTENSLLILHNTSNVLFPGNQAAVYIGHNRNAPALMARNEGAGVAAQFVGVVSVSGALQVSSGTAALPAITRTGDLNTGIYFPAADQLAITVGGAALVTVTTLQVLVHTYGSAANPAIAFAGDPNTGIFQGGAGRFDISVDGTNAVSVRASQTVFPDGTAAAPAISNGGDEDTGIYFPSDNVVGITVGGVQRVRVSGGAAALEVTSTTGGLLLPRMTSGQQNAIASPANGLLLYNTTTNKAQIRAAGAWVDLH